MSQRLAGKVALITGASSGFGRGIAELFAREGAKVAVVDLKQEPNQGGFEAAPERTVVEQVKELGGDAIFVKCNVTVQADVAAAVAETVATFGRLDIIVNNAGVYRSGKFAHEFSEDDLDACWSVNVKGTWFGSQEAVKQFLKQGDGGNIINLVSTAGLQGHPKQSPYNISKGAQANLTRCFAIEYGPERIRANGICPTYAKTAMARAYYDDPDFEKYFIDSIPLKRWGEISDVANLALFLASDESSFITGDMIKLDGGETLCRYSV